MKKVYFAHANEGDYENKFYKPLGSLKNIKFVFPYANEETKFSRDIIKKCDYLLADISNPAMGMGIEIGWANAFGVPIIFMYKRGSKVSSYLSKLSKNIIEYRNLEKELYKIKEIII